VAAPFRFDRSWSFPIAPDAFWRVLERTDAYPGWWSWLAEFDTDGLRAGSTAACTIQSPLPYALHCRIHVDELVPPRVPGPGVAPGPGLVATTIDGDLRGPARLEVEGDGQTSTARLVWSLELGSPVLGAFARVARPLMTVAHDVVVGMGVEQFRRRALVPEVGSTGTR
jgi:hypothetical protein